MAGSLTVEVDGAIAIEIDLANDLGDLLIRDSRVGLAHHPAEFLGRDVAASVLILQVMFPVSFPGRPNYLAGDEKWTHVFVEALAEDGDLLRAELSGLRRWAMWLADAVHELSDDLMEDRAARWGK